MSLVHVTLPILDADGDQALMLLAAGAAVMGPEREDGTAERIGTCIAATVVGREIHATFDIDPEHMATLSAMGLLDGRHVLMAAADREEPLQ